MASLRTTEQINLQLGRITIPASEVEREGKNLGNGSYGAVFTVRYRREVCAAKEIHSLLFEEAEEKLNLLDAFNRECCQCSELSHPNIVKFIGVYFPNKQLLPVMLMELMDKSLRNYLEAPQTQVTLITKSSILIDVADGLSYLHHSSPLIIHRDLTPNNVLLKFPCNKVPVAKISDLGVAKAIETNKKIKQRLTKLPGTPGFMPPEAFDENPAYTTSLDIFSFGGVVLFVANQKWPEPTASTRHDRKTNELVAFTEVQRRQQYLDKMEGGTKIWRSTVEACLSNDPDERPQIAEVSERLRSFKLMELQLRVKELVNKLEGKSYNDNELEHQFENSWKEWMDTFIRDKEQAMGYPSDSEIEEEIIRILRQQLADHDDLIVSKLLTKPLNERNCLLQLLINKDVHLTSTRWMGFKPLGSDDIALAKQLTEQCLTSARACLDAIELESKSFTSTFAGQTLKNLFKIIDTGMHTKNSGFEFKPEYKVDMAITICACASHVFKQTTTKHRDNNPIFKLNEIKFIFFNMCKDLYNSVNRHAMVAKVNNATEQKVHKDRTDTTYMLIIVSIIIIVIAYLYII